MTKKPFHRGVFLFPLRLAEKAEIPTFVVAEIRQQRVPLIPL
jgi:hypothetical protein